MSIMKKLIAIVSHLQLNALDTRYIPSQL